ncbi:hypothetical protein AWN76_017195 [Rhodothermaceae bacterium RA]|nr:hypothetical protein AWN76_017195 [Rhodothermaceae bacterium RA]
MRHTRFVLFRGGLLAALLIALAFWLVREPGGSSTPPAARPVLEPPPAGGIAPPKLDRQREAIERMAYEHRRLADPRTGRIPADIRARELARARHLPDRAALAAAKGRPAAAWAFRGPVNVGGRTRALAVDLDYDGTTNRRILAGGISGGVYLSTDGGQTWTMTSSLEAHPSVSTLVQDPNDRSVWYYGTGEFLGGSAGGIQGSHLGQGIFKSTDGGLSWTQIPISGLFGPQNDPVAFDDFFDIVWSLAIHPQRSVIFAATYGGILRSTDGGSTWQQVLGRSQSPFSTATDVVIASDGAVYATLSRNGGGFDEYGVFRSTDHGVTWTDITPPALAADPYRMVLGAAPSDAATVYLLAQINQQGATAPDHQLFRYEAGANAWTNLSANLPNVTENDDRGNPPASGNASFSSQGGYDLIVRVKPDDPDVVWIGGTNLYRSTDGGQTFELVGGYAGPYDYTRYPNHHPDQHALVFLPNDPNTVISGHDGGLSITNDALQSPQQWTSLNNGYVTTQFYTVALDPQPGSAFLLGGLQDNGTWGSDVADGQADWIELGSGDGAYGAIVTGGDTYYVSSQFAFVIRGAFVDGQWRSSLVQPAIPNPQFLFVTPFELDPNDERVMYLAEGDAVWRNSNLDGIPQGNVQPTSINWTELSASAVPNTQVTALAVSRAPANRLVFGATDYQGVTRIIRVDDPAANGAGTDITPPGATQGAYPSSIAMNLDDADEMLVTFSNYGVPSVWYTTDGGQTWVDVEGNLGGDDGPSVRWAAVVPSGTGVLYFLATSTGVYATETLAGTNTAWALEGAGVIGHAVVDMVRARPADGLVVAATHGRGMYSASIEPGTGGGTAIAAVSVPRVRIDVAPDGRASAAFEIRNNGTAPLTFSLQAVQPSAVTERRAALPGLMPPGARRNPSQRAAAPSRARPAGLRPPAFTAPPAAATDVLALDDGDASADDFIGFGDGSFFYWGNDFALDGADFRLEQIQFFMRTELVFSNTVDVTVYDDDGTALVTGLLSLGLAPEGNWFTVTLNTPLSFSDGDGFFVEIGARSGQDFPAGADTDAAVPGHSYYYDPDLDEYVSLATLQGFENGAFLVRAVGTRSTVEPNQPPNVSAQVSTFTAEVGQTITFDASGSTDPDGEIVAYLWDFGDGTTSAQAVTTHAYTAAGTYGIAVTVTDDDGASSRATGEITVIDTSAPTRLTLDPTSGRIEPDQARKITATFDATGVATGTYAGEIRMTSNGGNVTLPVEVRVLTNVAVDDGAEVPRTVRLYPNYPNPFNPETTIRYDLPVAGRVVLGVYDLAGRRIRRLVAGVQPAGPQEARWDGRDEAGRSVASGVYLYRLEAQDASGHRRVLTGKMTLLK